MDNQKKKHDAEDEPVRQGDILGLGGAAVPKTPADGSTSFERSGERGSDSIREDDGERRHKTAYQRSSGAASVDMGSGGTGTDIEE